MLCTKCSEVVHPVVAVDLDGTLGDWHRHFQLFAEDWLGRTQKIEAGHYDGRWRYRVWFCQAYGVDTTTFRAIKLAFRQSGLKRSMPPRPGAVDMMEGLAKLCEVWVTTTRPHDRYDRVDPDTVEWLRRNRIPYGGLLFDEDKVHELYRRVDPGRVVAVLDDEPRVLLSVVRGAPILLRTDYNYEADWNGMTAENLSVAWADIGNLLAQWSEEHE
jgi:hypothetical protein